MNRLRAELKGLAVQETLAIMLSAYADDVTIFIKGKENVQALSTNLKIYEKASFAKVNWGKS